MASTVSNADILSNITAAGSGGDIDAYHFRLPEVTDSDIIYGSRFTVYVDVDGLLQDSTGKTDEHAIYFKPEYQWGGMVFLRNDYSYFSSSEHFANWAMQQPIDASMDINDNGDWLNVGDIHPYGGKSVSETTVTNNFKRNWVNNTDGSEISLNTGERKAILDQVVKMSGSNTFLGYTEDDLLSGKVGYTITIESMIAVMMAEGMTLNGKTFHSSDVVWFTVRQFNKFADELALEYSEDDSVVSEAMFPLYSVFAKPHLVTRSDGSQYTVKGNMSITLHTKDSFAGWGFQTMYGDTSQSLFVLHVLSDANTGQLNLITVDAMTTEYGDMPLPYPLTSKNNVITTHALSQSQLSDYGVMQLNEADTALFKGYFRYFRKDLTDGGLMLNGTTTISNGEYIVNVLMSTDFYEPFYLGDYEILPSHLVTKSNINGYVNTYPLDSTSAADSIDTGNWQGYFYNAENVDITAPKSITVDIDDVRNATAFYDNTKQFKWDKVIMYLYKGTAGTYPEIWEAELSPVTPNPNPTQDFTPPDKTTLGSAYMIQEHDTNMSLLGDFTLDEFPDTVGTLSPLLASEKKKITQIIAVGTDLSLYPTAFDPIALGGVVDFTSLPNCEVNVVNTASLSAEDCFTKIPSELLDSVSDWPDKKLILIYDQISEGVAAGLLNAIGMIAPNELNQTFTATLPSVTGYVEALAADSDCNKRYWSGDYHADGSKDYDTCNVDESYDWTGDLSISYNQNSVYSFVGTNVIKKDSTNYYHVESASASASANDTTATIDSINTTYITDRKSTGKEGTLYIAKYMGLLNKAEPKAFIMSKQGYTEGIGASGWYTGSTHGTYNFSLVVPTVNGARPWEFDRHNTHHTDTNGSNPALTSTPASERTTDVTIDVVPFYAGAVIGAQADYLNEVGSANYYRIAKAGGAISYVPAIECVADYNYNVGGAVYITGTKTRSFNPIDVFEVSVTEPATNLMTYGGMWSRDYIDQNKPDPTLKAGSVYTQEGNSAGYIDVTVTSYITVPEEDAVVNGASIASTRKAEHTNFVNDVKNNLELESYTSVPYNYVSGQTLFNPKTVAGLNYSAVLAKYKGIAMDKKAYSVQTISNTSIEVPMLNQYYAAYGGSGASVENTVYTLGNGQNYNAVSNSISRLNASMDKSNKDGYYTENFPSFKMVKQVTVLRFKVDPSEKVIYAIHPRLSDAFTAAVQTSNLYAPSSQIGAIPSGKFGYGIAFNFKGLTPNGSSTKFTWYNQPKIFNIRGTINNSK